ERHAAVVPATLALGRIKLQQGRAAPAKERGPLLAEAERLFLAIRAEEEGQPAFHIALGQVYHRLGRTAEGDAELKKLLDGDDDPQKLKVAETYRDLGMQGKAIQLTEKLFASGGTPALKHNAAYVRSLLAAGLEEHEKWLLRSNVTDPAVALELKEVQ